MLGIITAVTVERDAVLHKMERTTTVRIYDLDFYQGLIHHTPCIIALSGIGKVNAARCTQLMIDRFRPSKIVNIGSAGAVHPDLNIGDVVIATACVQHDVDLTVFGFKKGAFDKQADGFIKTDADFAELCEAAIEKSSSDKSKVFLGTIATGDQFNDSLEKKAHLFEEFGAYCNEMEGAAVAQVCTSCQVPFVVIRSISDKPGNQSKLMYDNFKRLASERCVTFLEHLIAIIEADVQNDEVKKKGVNPVNQVESFELNHDQVTAPYIRKAKVMTVNPRFPECVISKFDVRFAQPNQKFIPNDALHTLEHLFAALVRKYTPELIDVSPMGCRTGFYFIFCNDKEVSWVASLVRKALQDLMDLTEAIPGATRQECGNYLEHDLESAKLWASKFLSVPENEITNIHR